MSQALSPGTGAGRIRTSKERPTVPLASQVRDALRHLYDPTRLQTHPLARYASPESEKRAAGRGKRLQDLLLAAIDALRPAAGTPAEAHAGRSHRLLVLRYVDGLDTAAVQSKLAISKTEYYLEHQRAIEAVTSWLEERWQPEGEGTGPAPRDTFPAPDPDASRGEVTRSTPDADAPRRHNLPLQLTSFVGRQAEIADVRHLLGESRLVTLTGVGGSGKTRLALQAAALLVDEVPDGVWLVELAQLADPDLVAPTVARAVGVPERSDRPLLDTLVAALRPKNLVLILDNCEHLIAACAGVAAAILRACPGVRILATSREALGIDGEVARSVPPLPVPPADWATDPPVGGIAALQDFAAVRLFVERARSAEPSFELSDLNASAVVQICRRVDGIPLAIELAAARVKVFAVERIEARLDDVFRLLAGGSRTALPRHQTLRAMIDWSHDLLSGPERALFRRLCVFVGGCSYEAIEAVCVGEEVAPPEIPDLLTRLVERSLVVVEHGASERYRLLETLRQYGQERLMEAGEDGRFRDRHRDWYLELALEAHAHFYGPDQGRWYRLLELDQDNLRAAIEWCIARGDARAGFEFVWALFPWWFFRGVPQESVSFAERLLALPGAEAPSRGRSGASWVLFNATDRDWERARRLGYEAIDLAREVGEIGASVVYALFLADGESRAGHDDRAGALMQESLATARRIGDTWLEGQAFEHLGALARRQGQYDRAFEIFRDSLACLQTGSDVRAMGSACSFLGKAALDVGDLALARESLRRGLETARSLRLPRHAIQALVPLAAASRLAGDAAGGRSWLAQAHAAARETGSPSLVGAAWLNLGYHDWVVGELDAADADMEQGLALLRESGRSDWWETGGQGDGTALAGVLALERGDLRRGVLLLGSAERYGFRPAARYPDERERYAALVRAAREGLGDASFAATLAEGRAMALERAISLALTGDGTL